MTKARTRRTITLSTGSRTNVVRAREAWNGAPPDWVLALAEACDATQSQKTVGREIGYSGSTVNQVLGASYQGDIGRVEAKVRGRYMAATVVCPILGEIPTNDCLDHQKRLFSAANPQRVKLFRTCPSCPHRRTKQ